MQPLVTVIIPAYNAGAYLGEAIDSARAQTYSPIEIIVVDDGSTDRTPALLAPYVSANKIKYIYQANAGVASARNAGINAARGKYIAFLDSDDRWQPDKLAKQLPLFADPKVGLVYSDMQCIGAVTGRYGVTVPRGYHRGRVLPALIKENFIGASTVVARRALLQSAGGFQIDSASAILSTVEDYHLWLRLARITNFDYVDEPLALYRVHAGQSSRRAWRTRVRLRRMFRLLLLDPVFADYRPQMRLRLLKNNLSFLKP